MKRKLTTSILSVLLSMAMLLTAIPAGATEVTPQDVVSVETVALEETEAIEEVTEETAAEEVKAEETVTGEKEKTDEIEESAKAEAEKPDTLTEEGKETLDDAKDEAEKKDELKTEPKVDEKKDNKTLEETKKEILEEEEELSEEEKEDLEVNLEEEELSTTDSSNFEVVYTEPMDNADMLAEQALITDKRALLIQDTIPWYMGTDVNQEVLGKVVPFDVTTTSGFIDKDIRDYSLIVFANDQGYSTYNNYAKAQDKLNDYVYNGGTVVFGACDAGWASGNLSAQLPGGVKKHNSYMYNNRVVDLEHPIVTGVLTNNDPMLDDMTSFSDFKCNYTSHVYFDTDTFQPGTNIIFEDTNGRPTLIEYPYGRGYVIASGLTWEFAYVRHDNGVVGPWSYRSYEDLFVYALKEAGVGNGNLDLIDNIQIEKNQHVVLVMDARTHEPIEGATVKFSKDLIDLFRDKTFTTDYYGRVKVEDLKPAVYDVKVTAPGYYDKFAHYEIANGDSHVIYMTTKAVGEADVNQALLTDNTLDDSGNIIATKTYDILTQNCYIVSNKKHSYTLEIVGEWEGKEISNYILTRGSKNAHSADGKFTITEGKFYNSWGEDVTFDEGLLTLRLEADNGTIRSKAIATKLNISPHSSGELWGGRNKKEFSIGNKVSFKVPDNMPVVGGLDFEVEFSGIPVSYQVDEEANEVRFVFGIADFEKEHGLKKDWDDFVKKFDVVKKTKKMYDLNKAYGTKKAATTLKKGWKFEPSIVGYAKGKYNPETGDVTEITGELVFSADAMYTYTQQFVIGPVPVYFEIGGGVTLEEDVKVTGILAEKQYVMVDSSLTVTPKFVIGGGVGIKGALSAGGKGTASLPIVLCQTQYNSSTHQTEYYTKVSLSGEMSLNVSVLFVFTGEWNVAKGTWEIGKYDWNNRKWIPTHEVDEQSAPVDFSDLSAYAPMSRSYLNNVSPWYTEVMGEQAYKDGMTVIKSGILPSTQPVICQLSDGSQIMVYQDDNTSRSANNRTQLMFSKYENGNWLPGAPVWPSSDTADSVAAVASGKAGTYVVWQKMNKSLSGSDNANTSAPYCDIAVAKFDENTNTFIDAKYIVNDNTLQMLPTVAVGDTTAYAVYVENTANALLGGAGSNIIYAQNLVTGEKTVIKDCGSSYVCSLDAECTGNSLNVAFTLDKDGDIFARGASEGYVDETENNIDDSDVYLYTSGAVIPIVEDNIAQANAQLHDGVVYWFDGSGSIKSYNNGAISQVVDGTICNLSQNFKVIGNGNKTGIIWVAASLTEESEKNVIYSAVNAGNGWSNAIEMVSSDDQILRADGYVADDGGWEIIATAGDVSNTILAYTGVKAYITTKATNIAAANRSEDQELYPVSCDFYNGCEERLTSLNVEFRNIVTGEIEYQEAVPVDINGGSREKLTLEVDLPLQIREEKYDVYIYAAGETDLDDNHGIVTLGYHSIEFKLTQEQRGDITVIRTVIKNNGEIPVSGYIKAKEYDLAGGEDPEDNSVGALVTRVPYDTLAPGATAMQTFQYNASEIEFAEDETEKIYYLFAEVDNKDGHDDEPDFISEKIRIVIENPYATEAEPENIVLNVPVPIELDRYNAKTYQLEPVILPRAADRTELIYTSSNEDVVTVDEDGLITAVGIGNAVVTISNVKNSVTATANVRVNTVKASQIDMEFEEIVRPGATKTLSYQVGNKYQIKLFEDENKGAFPADLFTYEVSDPTVANVTPGKGIITLLKPGTVTVKATSEIDDAVTVSETIKVLEKQPGRIEFKYVIDGVESEEAESQIKLAASENKAKLITLKPIVYAENGDLMDDANIVKSITYKSSNKTIATVNAQGVISLLGKNGTTVVYASVPNTEAGGAFTVHTYNPSAYEPKIVVGQSITLDSFKGSEAKIEIMPVAGSTISDVYTQLYEVDKDGWYADGYKQVYGGFSLSHTPDKDTTEEGGKIVRIKALSTAKAGTYFIKCRVNGEYNYFLRVDIKVRNVKPKVSVSVAGFNAFYTDQGGRVYINTTEFVEGISIEMTGKGLPGGYTAVEDGKTGVYYIKPVSGRFNKLTFKDYSTKFKMSVSLKGYDNPVVVNGKLKVKFDETRVKLSTTSAQYGTGSPEWIIIEGYPSHVAPEDNLKVVKVSEGSFENMESEGSVVRFKYKPRAGLDVAKKITVTFQGDNWVSGTIAQFMIRPQDRRPVSTFDTPIKYNKFTGTSTVAHAISGITKTRLPIKKEAEYYRTEDGLFVIETTEAGFYARALKPDTEYTSKNYTYQVPVITDEEEDFGTAELKIHIISSSPTVSPVRSKFNVDTSAKGRKITANIKIDKKTVAAWERSVYNMADVESVKTTVYKNPGKKQTLSTDFSAVFNNDDSIYIYNNRSCEGSYFVYVSPVLTNGKVLKPAIFRITAVNGETEVTATAGGKLDIRKRQSSTVKVKLQIKNNSSGIKNVEIIDANHYGVEIRKQDLDTNSPSVHLGARTMGSLSIGENMIPLRVIMNDGVKKEIVVKLKTICSNPKIAVQRMVFFAANETMVADGLVTVTKPAEDQIDRVEMDAYQDLFEFIDNGSGNITLKVKDRSKVTRSYYKIPITVHTVNEIDGMPGISTNISLDIK